MKFKIKYQKTIHYEMEDWIHTHNVKLDDAIEAIASRNNTYPIRHNKFKIKPATSKLDGITNQEIEFFDKYLELQFMLTMGHAIEEIINKDTV